MGESIDQTVDDFLAKVLGGEAVEVEAFLAGRPALNDSERVRLRGLAAALVMPIDVDQSDRVLPRLPSVIGAYRPLRELGRGGQGIVYLAEDTRLPRLVALKIMNSSTLLTDDETTSTATTRLKREAEAASRLRHPGICVIHEFGIHGNQPFIAMQWVDGETLGEVITRSRKSRATVATFQACETSRTRANPTNEPGSIMDVVQLIEKIAQALHVAHEAGIVHRDIKPANIMIDQHAEPVILDFGLARVSDSTLASLTESGDVFGSPAYMSPEQILGHTALVDRRTDIYSLGVTLFEALTLRRPFEELTRPALAMAITQGRAAHPRERNPALTRDIEVVIETALATDPDGRYSTASELAEDLRRFRHNEPIQARPAGRLLKVWRWTQRNRALTGALTAVLLTLAAGLGNLLHQADLDQEASLDAHVIQLLKTAESQVIPNPRLALLFAIEAARLAPGLESNLACIAALSDLRERSTRWSSDPSMSQAGGTADAHDFVLDPAGKWVAVALESNQVRIVSTDTWMEIARLDGTARVLEVSPDGSRLVTAAFRSLRTFNTTTWEQGREVPDQQRLTGCMAVSSDGSLLAMATQEPSGVRVMNLRSGVIREGPMLESSPSTCAFSPDDSFLALAFSDYSIGLWKLTSDGEVLTHLCGPPSSHGQCQIRFSPSGELLLVTGAPDGARILDIAENQLHSRPMFSGYSQSGAFDPDGVRVVTGTQRGIVEIWDASTGKLEHSLDGLQSSVLLARFAAQGRYVLATDATGTTCLWDSENGRIECRLSSHDGSVLDALIDAESATVTTFSRDGSIRNWSWETEREEWKAAPGLNAVRASLDPQGGRIVSLNTSFEPVVWDLGSNEEILTLAGHTGRVQSVGFDSAGSRVLTASFDGTVRLWDALTGDSTVFPMPERSPAWHASISPDGRKLLTASEDGVARLWDIASGQPTELRGHKGGVRHTAFTPDGAWALTTSEHEDDGSIRLWELAGAKRRFVLRAEDSEPITIAVSPDSRFVAGGYSDNTVRVWDLTTHQQLPPLVGHTGHIEWVDYSPDGALLASASQDRSVRIWKLADWGSELVRYEAPLGTTCTVDFAPDGASILCAMYTGEVFRWPVDPVQEAIDVSKNLKQLSQSDWEQFGLDSTLGVSALAHSDR